MNDENNNAEVSKQEQQEQEENTEKEIKEIDEERRRKRQEALLKAITSVEDKASSMQSDKLEKCEIF